MLEESKSGVGRKGAVFWYKWYLQHHLANSAVTCAGEASIKDDADNDCRIIHSPIRRMVAGAECKREVALRHRAWEDTMVTRHFGPL